MLIDNRFRNNLNDNYICDSTAAINDLVYFSDTTGEIIVAIDNNSPSPIIGFIKSKPTNTTACVQYFGKVATSGLIKGKKVFVGIDGKPTTTLPTTNYIQTIGVSTSDTEFLFDPNLNRILRS